MKFSTPTMITMTTLFLYGSTLASWSQEWSQESPEGPLSNQTIWLPLAIYYSNPKQKPDFYSHAQIERYIEVTRFTVRDYEALASQSQSYEDWQELRRQRILEKLPFEDAIFEFAWHRILYQEAEAFGLWVSWRDTAQASSDAFRKLELQYPSREALAQGLKSLYFPYHPEVQTEEEIFEAWDKLKRTVVGVQYEREIGDEAFRRLTEAELGSPHLRPLEEPLRLPAAYSEMQELITELTAEEDGSIDAYLKIRESNPEVFYLMTRPARVRWFEADLRIPPSHSGETQEIVDKLFSNHEREILLRNYREARNLEEKYEPTHLHAWSQEDLETLQERGASLSPLEYKQTYRSHRIFSLGAAIGDLELSEDEESELDHTLETAFHQSLDQTQSHLSESRQAISDIGDLGATVESSYTEAIVQVSETVPESYRAVIDEFLQLTHWEVLGRVDPAFSSLLNRMTDAYQTAFITEFESPSGGGDAGALARRFKSEFPGALHRWALEERDLDRKSLSEVDFLFPEGEISDAHERIRQPMDRFQTLTIDGESIRAKTFVYPLELIPEQTIAYEEMSHEKRLQVWETLQRLAARERVKDQLLRDTHTLVFAQPDADQTYQIWDLRTRLMRDPGNPEDLEPDWRREAERRAARAAAAEEWREIDELIENLRRNGIR